MNSVAIAPTTTDPELAPFRGEVRPKAGAEALTPAETAAPDARDRSRHASSDGAGAEAPARKERGEGPEKAGGARAKGEEGEAKAKPAAAKVLVNPDAKDRSFPIVMWSTAISILVAFAVGRSGLYTAGDNIGYYVGLVGGVMMLLLLLYPLRKYLAVFRNWGAVKYWFAVHMVLGIAGPILVLAHSTFHMKSINASVALVCMLVVAGSGIIGRFLYTKVHRGLYGEKMSLQELQKQASSENNEIRSRLHFAPVVEKSLNDFQERALGNQGVLVVDAVRIFGIAWTAVRTYRACSVELQRTMRATAKARGWDAAKYRRRVRAAKLLVKAYLAATQRVAQFNTYDRLLKLWHVAHVPLVYLLVISSIAHVVAVHMY